VTSPGIGQSAKIGIWGIPVNMPTSDKPTGDQIMLTIRPETTDDRDDIHHVNEEAFGQKSEAELVEKLRNRGMLAISLVALSDGHVVGHITFSPVTVKSENSRFQATALGPMAVLPSYQRKGIGSQLVPVGLEECRNLGNDVVVLVGHPDYYLRFGFAPARSRGIECEFEVPDEAWMLFELREGALADRRGTVTFRPEFREAM
jgi:putative acetyltransferase